MTVDGIEYSTGLFQKIKFYIVQGKMFFLIDSLIQMLIHFLVVEDYELPKSTTDTLSLPLTLE